MRATFDAPTDPAAYRFCHRLRARFAETDAMGVVHHAAYLPWLESARVEYLRAEGHPYAEVRAGGIEFPVVDLAVRYLQPARFDDQVEVHLVLAAARGASFEIGYLVQVEDEPRITAVTRHAVVTLEGKPVRCPEWLTALAADSPTL